MANPHVRVPQATLAQFASAEAALDSLSCNDRHGWLDSDRLGKDVNGQNVPTA